MTVRWLSGDSEVVMRMAYTVFQTLTNPVLNKSGSFGTLRSMGAAAARKLGASSIRDSSADKRRSHTHDSLSSAAGLTNHSSRKDVNGMVTAPR